MTRYRKSWTETIKEVILNEALKPLDKSVVDAFYYKKEKAGKVVSTDGDSLWKNGLGGQEIAIWMGRKIHISAVSDVKSTEAILKYMKKSIPSGVFEEVEATRMPMEAPFVLVEKWEAGVVYHQDFGGGEISYFRADSLLKNKRWKGMAVDEYSGKQKKPRNITADEKTSGWKITPKDKIPKGLKEELEEAVNLKKLKKEYEDNEDKNHHTENYLLLAKAFGSTAEVKKVQEIMKKNEKQGHTSKTDNDWMYKNINKYYDKIRNEEVEVAEAKMSDPMIAKLKDKYESLRGKRLSLGQNTEISKIVSGMGKDKEVLLQLVKADIPFISLNAATFLMDKHGMKAKDINLGNKIVRKQEIKSKIIDDGYHGTFAGDDVFIVDSNTFHTCRLGKQKYHRYEKYVGDGKIGQAIREFGLTHPKKPIILQNGEDGPMLYLRYGGSKRYA